MGYRGQKQAEEASTSGDGRARVHAIVWEAYLKVGEGEAAPSDAWRDARDRGGLEAASEACQVLGEVFGGGPVGPTAAREGRRHLADGYRAALSGLGVMEASAYRERVARVTARAVGEVPLALTLALEDSGEEEELQRLVDAAVSAAVAPGGHAAEASAEQWLERMESSGAPDVDEVLLASLALEVDTRRGARLVRLAEESSSPALLRFVSELPDLIREPGVARALARSDRATARAVLARALAQNDEHCEATLRGLFRQLDAEAAERAARLYGDLLVAAGHRIAGLLLGFLAKQWIHDVAPTQVVEKAGLPVVAAVSFLCGFGENLADRSVALACHEAVLHRGLAWMEEGGDPSSILDPFIRSAVALVRAGQGMAVASQLLGAGAQVSVSDGSSLTGWARLNLEIGRAATAAHPADALLFYVNLVSLYARAPERLPVFGPAAPLLWRVRSRLHVVEAVRPSAGEESISRADRERHFHDLARHVMEADGGHRSQVAEAEVVPPKAEVPPGEAGSLAAAAVSGARIEPPTRTGQTLRAFTGVEFFRRVISYPARWLGYRRDGRLEVHEDRLTLEQTSRFLGQQVRSERQEIPVAQVSRVRRMDRSPASLLVLGVVLLVVLTWLGVSVAYDGYTIKDGALIGAGLGAILLGLLLDGALYALFRSIRGATFFSVFLKGTRRPVRLAVPRGDAERILAAIRALRIDTTD